MDDAYNWIRAGRNRGRSALVIATDTALYARGDDGEATQGAGAVAMLISEDPNLVELSAEQGYGSADETDFLKPNQQFPSVDGKRSVQVYLARMREASRTSRASPARSTRRTSSTRRSTRRSRGWSGKPPCSRSATSRATPRSRTNWPTKSVASPAPRRSTPTTTTATLREYMDLLKGTDRYAEWYDTTIDPTLTISREVGNWYTGSVHVARASALKHALENDRDLAGKKLLVGSYGSGAQAEIHAETIREAGPKRSTP